MNARPDFALCSVGPRGCNAHAMCARAQLAAHPTRQAYCTPNKRGDECREFVPLSNFEAADSATSAGQKGTTPTARADTHSAASALPASHSAGVCSSHDGKWVAGGGERSNAAGISAKIGPYGCRCSTMAQRVVGDGCDICNPTIAAEIERDNAEDIAAEREVLRERRHQLHAARVISGRAQG